MVKNIKIAFLQAAQKQQAADILSNAFNWAACEIMPVLDVFANGNNTSHVIFVASTGNKVVGTIRCDGGPEGGSLSLLAVDPAERRQGIAHALMSYAENYIFRELAQGNPCTISLIDGTKTQDVSSTFYQKMGYKPIEPPQVSPEGEPVLVKRMEAESAVPRRKREPRLSV